MPIKTIDRISTFAAGKHFHRSAKADRFLSAGEISANNRTRSAIRGMIDLVQDHYLTGDNERLKTGINEFNLAGNSYKSPLEGLSFRSKNKQVRLFELPPGAYKIELRFFENEETSAPVIVLSSGKMSYVYDLSSLAAFTKGTHEAKLCPVIQAPPGRDFTADAFRHLRQRDRISGNKDSLQKLGDAIASFKSPLAKRNMQNLLAQFNNEEATIKNEEGSVCFRVFKNIYLLIQSLPRGEYKIKISFVDGIGPVIYFEKLGAIYWPNKKIYVYDASGVMGDVVDPKKTRIDAQLIGKARDFNEVDKLEKAYIELKKSKDLSGPATQKIIEAIILASRYAKGLAAEKEILKWIKETKDLKLPLESTSKFFSVTPLRNSHYVFHRTNPGRYRISFDYLPGMGMLVLFHSRDGTKICHLANTKDMADRLKKDERNHFPFFVGSVKERDIRHQTELFKLYMQNKAKTDEAESEIKSISEKIFELFTLIRLGVRQEHIDKKQNEIKKLTEDADKKELMLVSLRDYPSIQIFDKLSVLFGALGKGPFDVKLVFNDRTSTFVIFRQDNKTKIFDLSTLSRCTLDKDKFTQADLFHMTEQEEFRTIPVLVKAFHIKHRQRDIEEMKEIAEKLSTPWVFYKAMPLILRVKELLNNRPTDQFSRDLLVKIRKLAQPNINHADPEISSISNDILNIVESRIKPTL